jgi:predicted MFS family arabinose efflux permease
MNRYTFSSWLPSAFVGLLCLLVGIGIGRFSYVVLLPLLIDARWASPFGAAQLATANLIGYLVGALTAHRIALKVGASHTVRGAMLAVLLSLCASSLNWGLAWLWIWRLVAGMAGGLLVILSLPYLLSRVPVAMRGRTVGLAFSGLGCGIVLSGFMVPAFGVAKLSGAWLGLAAFVAVALVFAWPAFAGRETKPEMPRRPGKLIPRGALLALMCAYTLDAAGYLPHTVFWVEYLVHGLGKPLSTGGVFWAVFGAGAVVGPLVTGYAADRFGFRETLIACLALKAVAVVLPVISTSSLSLLTSSFAVGALTPGVVSVTSGRVLEIVGVADYQRNWATLTFVYAVVQAATAYAMATLYAATHSFTALFVTGGAALGMAAVIMAINPKGEVVHPD